MNDKVRGGVGSGAHTPGPIRMRDVGGAHCLYFGNHGRPFATMYHANMPREEASRLMATLAAAPELLAALLALADRVAVVIESDADDGKPEDAELRTAWDAAGVAIAKAGGRS